jgi:nicotinamide-nucleotide amidase
MDRFGNPGAENVGRRQDFGAEPAVRDERGRTDYAPAMPEPKPPKPPKLKAATAARPLRTAVLLAVGTELTVGETRDTNSGDLARSLAERGVEVEWVMALPDRLATVVDALRNALAAADFAVTTGGLGPTPDDLTREAIAAVVGERPAVDPGLESWLRHLFERRGIAYHGGNAKQAWLIPSATAIPNERGTAPGWWVDRPDGRVIVALPGPPAEMRPMWEGWVLPHLAARGLGQERVTRTYRLAGIGESAVAALLGERLLRAENPVVATYARSDAVDVRISARADAGRSPEQLVEEAANAVLAVVGAYVWGRDGDTWPGVLGRELSARGWTAALVEAGTGGATMRLLGDAPWLVSSRLLAPAETDAPIATLAEQARNGAAATVGLAVRAIESGEDTRVDVAVSGPWGAREAGQTAFLGGTEGRRRAGVAAAAFLHAAVRDAPPAGEDRSR